MFAGKKDVVVVSKMKTKKSHPIPEGYPADWNEKRKKTIKKAKGACSYCKENGLTLHTHHMIPLSKCGSNELSNLVCICIRCHSILHPSNSILNSKYEQELIDKFDLPSKYGMLCDHLMNIEMIDDNFETNEGFDLHEDNIITKQ